MPFIKKLKLINFKKFKNLEIELNKGINTIIGDNEAGKSTILDAIELATSGSRHKVEAYGIECVFNKECVQNFLAQQGKVGDLPEIHIEAYLDDITIPELLGKHNSEAINTYGIHMMCIPNEELTTEISQILNQGNHFPFEYYITKFITFSGEAYSSYRPFLKSLKIDSSSISSEHANREYIKTVYNSSVDEKERIRLQSSYRHQKEIFKKNELITINQQHNEYELSIRSDAKSNLETDLTLTFQSIPIDSRGKGMQCFIKTEFALNKTNNKTPINTILLEEPENHLSHSNMKKLIEQIQKEHQKQIIIATHSSLISTRLDLRRSILLNSNSDTPTSLESLSEDTAKFFIKAPDNNILEFSLSKKVILVEGDAEFMMINTLYKNETSRCLEEDEIHVISVGGTSFKRYMELAKKLKIKTAVIRDNDKNHLANCITNYAEHTDENIAVFSDENDERYTFEICIYQDNKELCDRLFSGGRIQKAPHEYMLDNKTESAFKLINNNAEELKTPDYIKKAFTWINA